MLGITGPEAAKFAEWLGAGAQGGDFPTCEQWDQAAGEKNDNRRKPFPGAYILNDPTGPAVGGRNGAPRPVNRLTRETAQRPRMSGHVGQWPWEWTRLLPGESSFNNVRMRPRSYQSDRPFTFEDTDTKFLDKGQQEYPFDFKNNTIGFRVVIELE